MKQLLVSIALVLFFSDAQALINLRTQPLLLANQVWNLEADFPVSSAWTLGPMVRYIDSEQGGYDVTAWLLGIRGNYSFKGKAMEDSWYFAPIVGYLNIQIEDDNTIFEVLKGKGSGFFTGALFGYQWFVDNFNITLGMGPIYYSINKIKLKSSDGSIDENYRGYSGLGVALDFSLGFKF